VLEIVKLKLSSHASSAVPLKIFSVNSLSVSTSIDGSPLDETVDVVEIFGLMIMSENRRLRNTFGEKISIWSYRIEQHAIERWKVETLVLTV
jgi:hypothetical protein